MRKELIYSLGSLYRSDMEIYGYKFGSGEKSCCIVGAIRGNEIQQLYVCTQIIKALKELEEKGAIANDNEIMVVPSVNQYSMNVGKRFWAIDNTDINRMFPGDAFGETTQRIADGVFKSVSEYNFGIQFTSFYMEGDFIPHVRMMDTGKQNPSLANLFGLPYVVIRKPCAFDSATLNYNWQLWDTGAFSLYTSATGTIDEPSARQAVASVLRFLTRMGIIRYNSHNGYIATIIEENELYHVKNTTAGIFRRIANPGDEVHFADVLAEIIDPCEGEVINQVLSPTDGIIFFAHNAPLAVESEVLFKIIRRLHN